MGKFAFPKVSQAVEHHVPILFGALAGFLGRIVVLREENGGLLSVPFKLKGFWRMTGTGWVGAML
jgi:hypothetical protein